MNIPGIPKAILGTLFCLAFLSLTGCSSTQTLDARNPELALEGWDLVWHDEFAGDAVDLAYWTYDLGGGGWGNNEWEYYTDRPENARVEDGLLIIEARKESFSGQNYTSARLKTQGLHSWTYGHVEARMKLPTGQGIWPAFWMLGEDIVSTGWPQCGEIDIMENIGDPTTVHGTIHGPGYAGVDSVGSSLKIDTSLSDDFHVYAIDWTPNEIRWYVDKKLFHAVTPEDVPGDWVFDHNFFLLLNLAVGGNWPGYPDETTIFPQKLYVDYVRVYESASLD